LTAFYVPCISQEDELQVNFTENIMTVKS